MKNLCFLIMLVACACQSFKEQSPLNSLAEEVRESHLTDTSLFRNMRLTSLQSVKSFYALRDFSLFWSDGGNLSPAADSLLKIIDDANRFGLIPHDYHQEELGKILGDSLLSDRLSRMDLLLTDGYLTLYRHLRYGRLDPQTLQRSDLSLTSDAQAIASLEKIHTESMFRQLSLMEPAGVQYHQLKNALQSFRLMGKTDSLQRQRADKISLNMERWRWQKQWPDRYVFVNIPAFSLRVIEKDSVWLKTKVIVGKRETPTPVLESVITSFIIYPYWHVPFSISTKEILADLQADAAYLSRNNFEVLDRRGALINSDTIRWKIYSKDFFPFILRQREGTENSMGIIKFNFANNYGVYLHDTNSKRLFKRTERDLSHGCVRVDQAVSFAHYLIREDDIYVSPEDLDQYLSLQQRLKIELRKPIALKLAYFTSEVENGTTFFYEDIYKKDSLMMRALYNPVETAPPFREKPSF